MAPSATENGIYKVSVPTIAQLQGQGKLVPRKWHSAADMAGAGIPCRLEGEIEDLVVLGEVPKEIDGTFYRVMTDPFVPPHPGTVPVDGDGHVSAFRFYKGKVDFKMRYVETQRYLLERRAGKALFGLYRNPYTHHPCVRAAVDSTANTNILLWNDKLIALKENGLPYYMDPDTLETLGYDPWKANKIASKTFTAHPKIDPFKNELVTFGYEAKGLCTLDTVAYSLDQNGKAHNEFWCQAPYNGFIHESAITENFQILLVWPFEGSIERMKAEKHHWAWNYDIPAMWMILPRTKEAGEKYGWKEGEYRWYQWENCMTIHSCGAWEENGKVYLETSRLFDNGLPFFIADSGQQALPAPKCDFTRWEFDLTQPSGTKCADPYVILDMAGDMARMDERFMTKKYRWFFAIVSIPGTGMEDSRAFLYNRTNGIVKLDHTTGKYEVYNAGDQCICQEPAFIPRSDDAPEGDGYILSMIDNQKEGKSHVVVLDTRNFSTPVAIIQLPVRIRAQIHGNWVPGSAFKERKPLIKQVGDIEIIRDGALEPLVI